MRVRPLLAGEILISRSFSMHPHGLLGAQRGMLRQIMRRGMRWAPVRKTASTGSRPRVRSSL